MEEIAAFRRRDDAPGAGHERELQGPGDGGKHLVERGQHGNHEHDGDEDPIGNQPGP